MNGITRTPHRIDVSRPIWVVLTLIGVGVLGSGETRASAITSSTSAGADAAAADSWSEYLLGGPSVWAKVPHPPITSAIESEIWQDIKTDPGATDPMIQYLLWKQSIDPTRFAANHPDLSPALTKIADTSPQEINPSPPSTGGSGTEPQTIPEPGSLLVTLGLAGWAVYWRRRGG
jgi:PEP-CTERM motif